jgi:uncharacterized repeat protein (TIGR01451 family)
MKKQYFLFLYLFFAFLSTLNAQKNPLIRKPDLSVANLSNLRLETAEQRIYFDISVKNIGTADANMKGVKFQCILNNNIVIYDESIDDTGALTMKTNPISLSPGETGIVSNLWISTSDKDLSQFIYITCYLDASNIISEQKENNNSLTLVKHWQ